VIDTLKLEKPVVMGCSYGGGILLNLAAYAPTKIGKAILVVPSGLTPLPLLPMITRIGFPMIMYRMTRKHSWLIRNLSALYPNPSERFVEATRAIYQHVKLEAGMPRTIHREELKAFRAPTLVLAGEKDILFPASAVIPRSRAAIPTLVAAEVLPGSSHFLPPQLWEPLCERIDRFIKLGK
jgi:pimeloyl-ACP methyl ester carboxylesterase